MVLIKLPDLNLELLAFLPRGQQLSDLLAPFLVLWPDLPQLSPSEIRTPWQSMVDGLERVLGIPPLVFFLRQLGLRVPFLTLLVGELLPSHAYYLGQGAVTRLDTARDPLAPDERRTEKNECIWGTGDVVGGLPLSGCGSTRFEYGIVEIERQ